MLKFQQKVIFMEKYLETLKMCPLFYGIGDEDLLRMLTCLGAKTVKFDKKYTVVAEGNSARHIGIMLSGSVSVTQMDYDGNRSIVGNVVPPEMFMEAFACAEVRKVPLSVVANEESEIMFIDCSHILHTCHNNCGFHQQLIFNLMKNLAAKNIELHRKAEITSKRTTREKLMAYLNMCAKKSGSRVFEIPFDRQELADYLQVERSGLSAEISKLRREGILQSERNRFELL